MRKPAADRKSGADAILAPAKTKAGSLAENEKEKTYGFCAKMGAAARFGCKKNRWENAV